MKSLLLRLHCFLSKGIKMKQVSLFKNIQTDSFNEEELELLRKKGTNCKNQMQL